MDDLISRQAAIDVIGAKSDEIYKTKQAGATFPHDDLFQGMAYAADIVKNMPSAQPEPQWILCDERMPEEHEWIGTKKFGTTISDEVYVTFENEKGERFCKHLSFQNGKLSSFDQSTIDAFYKGSKPIAWMPLPEPWRGEANKDDRHN